MRVAAPQRSALVLLLAVLPCSCAPAAPGVPADAPALVTPLEGIDVVVAARVESARRTVRQHTTSARAWEELALTCEANELLRLAADAYGTLSLLEPREPRWWYRLGVVEARRERRDEARAAFATAIRLGDTHACARWRLGFLELEAGELAAAEASFAAARRLDPRDPAGWVGGGRVLLQRDAWAAAARAFEQALGLAPGDRYAHGLLGVAYRGAGRWSEAEPQLGLAATAGPRFRDACDAPVRAHLASSTRARLEEAKDLLALGRAAEAVPLLEGVLAEDAGDVGTGQLLARALESSGRLAEARVAWERCLAAEPDNLWSLVNAAVLHGRLGALEEALALCARAHALAPDFGAAHEIRGGLLLAAGRKGEAVQAYRQALRLDQRNHALPLRVALLELELGRHARALELLEPLTARGGRAPDEAWVALARIYGELGRIDEARAALERVPVPPGDATLLREMRAVRDALDEAEDAPQ